MGSSWLCWCVWVEQQPLLVVASATTSLAARVRKLAAVIADSVCVVIVSVLTGGQPTRR